ncbi:MAG: hypothetical protein K2F88_09000, partial [Duncaniella sp.]|nr:hypothetical protein [Duncaniella sp.]
CKGKDFNLFIKTFQPFIIMNARPEDLCMVLPLSPGKIPTGSPAVSTAFPEVFCARNTGCFHSA